jgi:hypothetical protein
MNKIVILHPSASLPVEVVISHDLAVEFLPAVLVASIHRLINRRSLVFIPEVIDCHGFII